MVLDARDEPADVTDFAEDPRTIAYGRLSLQIPADWELGDLDDCGHVQGDTLVLGLGGQVTCDEGERDPEASDVVVSSLTGRMVAPAPAVRLRPVTLPSGLRAERGTTPLPRPGTDEDEDEDDETDPLRTTVLRIRSLDAQVVATSRNPKLVTGILNSAKRIPVGSPATSTVAYWLAALDLPRSWDVNAVRCGIPTADTVILGHPGKPRQTRLPGEECPRERPPGVTDIYLEALDTPFGRRWGVIATDPVTLLAGIKGLRGTKVLPSGLTVTVLLVPDLRTVAVARSANQALVEMIMSTAHPAVPSTEIEEDQPTTTPTPQPTARPTLPAGVETRTAKHVGLALAVPRRWSDNDLRCGVPQSNTVVTGAPTVGPPGCTATRPLGVSEVVIDRLYGDYGALWMAAATEPITLPSGLTGLRGTSTSAEGLPVTVWAFPTIDAIIVATAADDGDAQDLIDGILTTARETRARPGGSRCSARCWWPTAARSPSARSARLTSWARAPWRCSRTRTATPSTG